MKNLIKIKLPKSPYDDEDFEESLYPEEDEDYEMIIAENYLDVVDHD